ncbi:hypothetical protein BGZ99_010403 [Dissophora globulifera]|uniref:SLC41A/MgtE integral membrane domain-containing protein n=1 Tax=Dissophora globulifera TaxID=979702 RepID=A0A9P6UM59_9FUNG|nr:hypothetical protein BGZ99_010403 [Dissophora globulifera]
MQASTTLVSAVSGLICAGWLFDVIQLIILTPILLNLKGNLGMSLASRLSTAANVGLLKQRLSRNAFIKGNLVLLQVQSPAVGSVAGLFSFGQGVVVHPTTNNVNEISLMITANSITCQLASSFEGLVALVILAGCSVSLQKYISTPLPVILLFILLGMTTAWIMYVRRNKFVSEVAKEGWVPVFSAMVIASTAGLTSERFIIEYPGMALMSPVLNGLRGNIESIYASRISTSLHVNIKENYRVTEKKLFLVHIPIQIIFLIVIGALGLGLIHWSEAVVLGIVVPDVDHSGDGAVDHAHVLAVELLPRQLCATRLENIPNRRDRNGVLGDRVLGLGVRRTSLV